MNIKETKKNIIQAGQKAVEELIKVAKEASELSKKLSLIYGDKEFEEINNIFNNNLIQKTMT